MVGSGFQGYPNVLILAYNEWITEGKITTIKSHADSTVYPPDNSASDSNKEPFTLKYTKDYSFHIENGRLTSYTCKVDEPDYGNSYIETVSYEYDLDGRLSRVFSTEKSWGLLNNVQYQYDGDIITVMTSETQPSDPYEYYRRWTGTVVGNQLSWGSFFDQCLGDANEIADYYTYNSRGLLIGKSGNNLSQAFIEYDENDNIILLNGMQFERMDVQIL